MEYNKKLQVTTPLKAIPELRSSSSLWRREPMGRRVLVKLRSMLPTFSIPAECQRGLLHPKCPGWLSILKSSRSHYLSLHLSQGGSSERKAKIQSDRSGEVLSGALELIQDRVDSAANYLEPLDLCEAFVHVNRSHVSMTLVFPAVPLQFQSIPSISIVSTPLTEMLVSRSHQFSTGFVTMDQRKRLLPLTVTDPMAYKFPLLGVWAKAVPEKNYPFTHPLVWASCIRFLTSSRIADRIGPGPTTFLFVYFGEKTQFFEVSIQELPVWGTVTESLRFSKEEILKFSFLREKKTETKPPLPAVMMSVSSEDKHSTRESLPEMPKAEALIHEQEKALKMLQRQVKDLQSKLNSKSCRNLKEYTKELKKSKNKQKLNTSNTHQSKNLNCKTQRTKEYCSKDRRQQKPCAKMKGKNSVAIDSSFGVSYLKRHRKNNERISSKSLPNRVDNIKTKEGTFTVPKIEYESSEESSEDDGFQEIQKKYLSNL